MKPAHIRLLARLVILLAAAAGPAIAQDRPQAAPTRDVAVDYRTRDQDGTEIIIRMSYGAKSSRIRVESPAQPGFAVMDRIKATTMVVLPDNHGYLIAPLDPTVSRMFELDPKANYERGESTKIAGVECTTWKISGSGPEATACVTVDGVILRARVAENDGPTVEAVAVTYKDIPESQFAPPAGFKKLEMPKQPAR